MYEGGWLKEKGIPFIKKNVTIALQKNRLKSESANYHDVRLSRKPEFSRKLFRKAFSKKRAPHGGRGRSYGAVRK